MLDKPFKDYYEQIEILKDRNLIMDDLSFAVHALSEYSYYSLINGVGEVYLKSKNLNVFKDGTSIEELVAVYVLDKHFRTIILSQIMSIEKSLKTKLSYWISFKYGADNNGENSYIRINNYSSKHSGMRRSVINNAKDIMSSKTKHKGKNKSSSLMHYINNHNHIPPWILIDEMTLGEVQYFYKIFKSEDKDMLSKSLFRLWEQTYKLNYNERLEFTSLSLEMVRKYRNLCAHGDLIIKSNVSAYISPKFLIDFFDNEKIISTSDIKNGISSNGLYVCILTIVSLTDDTDQLNIFLNSLLDIKNAVETSSYDIISIYNIFKLPSDFYERISAILKWIS
ncbi:Abi family protein [Apilactobacillus micheneri]|uniref:Abi family protein n=1 Tax=Apilactobacillus micheneri TaxID=1899430 RepID=UPI00112DB6E6|nr:Abi family protein [Apilactobacillus micheneri]TPR40449.1 hypothetical protein DY119_01795 [Apilactobacillus micheneri]